MSTQQLLPDPIYITKPSLPPIDLFMKGIEDIWSTRILTNNGPYHQELESELTAYLNVPFLSLFANATLALYTAIKVLKVDNSNIITTPFTFPATAHVIKLAGSYPVFQDIDPKTCCMSVDDIEKNIKVSTRAILPVHVYGNSCDVKKLSEIAKLYNLKIIYDAAHCFAPSNSLLMEGDLSVLSFHATKIFNTLEGGAIVSHDLETKEKIDRFKNFGISDEDEVVDIGFNAKMNEIQSLLGLLNLRNISKSIDSRKKLTDIYNKHFYNKIKTIPSSNYSYYPILVNNRDHVYRYLRENNIYARKYFYPLISNLESYNTIVTSRKENLPVSNDIAEKILCLPLYPALTQEQQLRIIKLVLEVTS